MISESVVTVNSGRLAVGTHKECFISLHRGFDNPLNPIFDF